MIVHSMIVAGRAARSTSSPSRVPAFAIQSPNCAENADSGPPACSRDFRYRFDRHVRSAVRARDREVAGSCHRLDPRGGYIQHRLRLFRYLVRTRTAVCALPGRSPGSRKRGRGSPHPDRLRGGGAAPARATGPPRRTPRRHTAAASPAGSAGSRLYQVGGARRAARASAWHEPARRTLITRTRRRLRLLSTPHSRQYTLQSDRNSVLSLSLSRFSLLSTLDRCPCSRHCRLVSRRPFSLGLSPPPSLSRTHAETFQSGVARTVCNNIV